MADGELSRCEWWSIESIWRGERHIDGPYFITLACAMGVCRFRKVTGYANASVIHHPDIDNKERENFPHLDEDYWIKAYTDTK